MKTDQLLSKAEETKSLRLLQRSGGPSKAFLEIWGRVRSRAIKFALDQQRVKDYLGTHRYAVVGADLRPMRGERLTRLPQRIGEIGIYDYDRNALLVVGVDLRKQTIVDIEERTGVQPPLSSSELTEAKTLALADKRMQNRGKTRALQVEAFAARVSFLHDHPASGHRVFTLMFWSGGKNPRKLGEMVVDLSDRKVLSDDDHDDAVLARLLEGSQEHGGKAKAGEYAR
jgi:hypothetical protein